MNIKVIRTLVYEGDKTWINTVLRKSAIQLHRGIEVAGNTISETERIISPPSKTEEFFNKIKQTEVTKP